MKTKHLLLILTIVLLFSACGSRYDTPQNYFIPHEANALKLTKKHDLVATGSVGLNTFSYDYFNPITFDFVNYQVEQWSGNFQVAYSPIKHLGVFGSHARMRSWQENNNSNVFHKSHLTSVGVGTYYGTKFLQRPLDKILPGRKEKFDKIVLDLYGGYTVGKLQNNFFRAIGNDEFNIHKLYFQAGLHWEVGNLGLSFLHKRGIGTYPRGTVNGEGPFSQSFKVQKILDNNQINFTETSFQLDYKRNLIGFYAQYTLNRVEEFGYLGSPEYVFNFGVTVDIHNIKNQRKSKSAANKKKSND